MVLFFLPRLSELPFVTALRAAEIFSFGACLQEPDRVALFIKNIHICYQRLFDEKLFAGAANKARRKKTPMLRRVPIQQAKCVCRDGSSQRDVDTQQAFGQ